MEVKILKTKDALHNLNMSNMGFYSPKWKKRKLIGRQITFDTKGFLDAYSIIDPKTLELFVHFDAFGTKANPRIIKIEKLSENYLIALRTIFNIESGIISIMSNSEYKELKLANTYKKLQNLAEKVEERLLKILNGN